MIQAQRDLAIARNNEPQAMLDYQLSNVNFETVQQSGAVSPLSAIVQTTSTIVR